LRTQKKLFHRAVDFGGLLNFLLPHYGFWGLFKSYFKALPFWEVYKKIFCPAGDFGDPKNFFSPRYSF
jgi:hypothetical protein